MPRWTHLSLRMLLLKGARVGEKLRKTIEAMRAAPDFYFYIQKLLSYSRKYHEN